MYTNLLLATDGSQLSEKAVDHAIGLASKLGAKLNCLYVAPDYPVGVYMDGGSQTMSNGNYEKSAATAAKEILDKVQAKAAATGVHCENHHAISDRPHEAILRVADTFNCDAIVMGSHGRTGISALLLGSQTRSVLAHTTLPVIVAR